MSLKSDEVSSRRNRLADILVWVSVGAMCGFFWRELARLIIHMF